MNNQELVVMESGQQDVLFLDFNSNNLTLSQIVSLDHELQYLTINVNAKLVAAAGMNDISILTHKNKAYESKKLLVDVKSDISQIGILSDKVVYTSGFNTSTVFSGANQINYVTLLGAVGSPLRLAQRYLTHGIVMANRSGPHFYRSGSLYLPQNLEAEGIENIKIEWSTNMPDAINLQTGDVSNILFGDALLTAKISGEFRFETISIEKTFRVF
jgi:hypothetical protein